MNRKITLDCANTCRFIDLWQVEVCTSSSKLCGSPPCLPHRLLGKTSCSLKLVISHSESLLCIKQKLLFVFPFMAFDFFIYLLLCRQLLNSLCFGSTAIFDTISEFYYAENCLYIFSQKAPCICNVLTEDI